MDNEVKLEIGDNRNEYSINQEVDVVFHIDPCCPDEFTWTWVSRL